MSPNRTVKFLLVEDDDDHARLIERSIAPECSIDEFHRIADGEEATKYLKNLSVDSALDFLKVIILDIKIPKVSGLSLLKMVKSDERLSKIPVVIFSTSDNLSDREEAYQNRVNSYLVKPLDFGEFRQLVAEMTYYWGVENVI